MRSCVDCNETITGRSNNAKRCSGCEKLASHNRKREYAKRLAMKPCVVSWCKSPQTGKELCAMHKRRLKYGLPMDTQNQRPPQPKDCLFSGCPNKPKAKGLCAGHYSQARSGKALEPLYIHNNAVGRVDEFCIVEGCLNRPRRKTGHCSMHSERKRLGKADNALYNGSKGYREKLDPRSGYVYVSFGRKDRRLKQRVVMAEWLGRPLNEHENVHHKNGDRADNRIENLELWSRKQPSGQRVLDKLAWAREIVSLYEPIEDRLRQLDLPLHVSTAAD